MECFNYSNLDEELHVATALWVKCIVCTPWLGCHQWLCGWTVRAGTWPHTVIKWIHRLINIQCLAAKQLQFASQPSHSLWKLVCSTARAVPQTFTALTGCLWRCQSLKLVTVCQDVRSLSEYVKAEAGSCGSQDYIYWCRLREWGQGNEKEQGRVQWWGSWWGGQREG